MISVNTLGYFYSLLKDINLVILLLFNFFPMYFLYHISFGRRQVELIIDIVRICVPTSLLQPYIMTIAERSTLFLLYSYLERFFEPIDTFICRYERYLFIFFCSLHVDDRGALNTTSVQCNHGPITSSVLYLSVGTLFSFKNITFI